MRTDIVIQTTTGKLTVRAIVRGSFAFVPSDRMRGWWGVTHVPTGLAIYFYTMPRHTAIRFVRYLQAQPIDWAALRNDPTSPAWKQAHAVVLAWTRGKMR